MIIDEEVYQEKSLEFDTMDFLEHHGVKGQKWGIRKWLSDRKKAHTQKYGSNKKAFTGNLTQPQLRERKKRAFRFAVGVGLVYVAAALAQKRVPVNNIGGARSTARGAKATADILHKERDAKAYAISRHFKEGFIDEAQRDKFLKVLNDRYTSKLVNA